LIAIAIFGSLLPRRRSAEAEEAQRPKREGRMKFLKSEIIFSPLSCRAKVSAVGNQRSVCSSGPRIHPSSFILFSYLSTLHNFSSKVDNSIHHPLALFQEKSFILGQKSLRRKKISAISITF
jgi:hypothetical protein